VSPEKVHSEGVPFDKGALRERMLALQSEMAAINKQLDELEAAGREEGAENDPL
jgi:hypothetical protein